MLIEQNQIEQTDRFGVSIRTTTGIYDILSEDVVELSFIEDIYSYCMVGKLVFIDKLGLLEFGTISGTDIVHIVYGQEKNIKTVSFHIQNMIPTLVGRDIYRVEATLVHPIIKKLNLQNYSVSFSEGTLYTDVVKMIMDKHLGININNFQMFEDGVGNITTFDTSNSSVSDNIQWLSSRAKGKDSGQPGYLFYQNTSEKQWNFVTLEKLLQQNKNMYIFDKDEMYLFENVPHEYVNRITSHKIKKINNFDVPFLTRSNSLGYNPEIKAFIDRTYVYSDILKNFTILGKYSLFESIQLTPYIHTNNETRLTGESDPVIMDNMHYGNWIKKYCSQQLIEIVVKGHENRYAGGMIELVWKSKDTETEKYHQYLNGKCLIKSITHIFSNTSSPKYQQVMVLIKNGYGDAQEGNFIKSIKKNV